MLREGLLTIGGLTNIEGLIDWHFSVGPHRYVILVSNGALRRGDTQFLLLALALPLIRGQRVVALAHQTSAPDVEEDVRAVCG